MSDLFNLLFASPNPIESELIEGKIIILKKFLTKLNKPMPAELQECQDIITTIDKLIEALEIYQSHSQNPNFIGLLVMAFINELEETLFNLIEAFLTDQPMLLLLLTELDNDLKKIVNNYSSGFKNSRDGVKYYIITDPESFLTTLESYIETIELSKNIDINEIEKIATRLFAIVLDLLSDIKLSSLQKSNENVSQSFDVTNFLTATIRPIYLLQCRLVCMITAYHILENDKRSPIGFLPPQIDKVIDLTYKLFNALCVNKLDPLFIMKYDNPIVFQSLIFGLDNSNKDVVPILVELFGQEIEFFFENKDSEDENVIRSKKHFQKTIRWLKDYLMLHVAAFTSRDSAREDYFTKGLLGKFGSNNEC